MREQTASARVDRIVSVVNRTAKAMHAKFVIKSPHKDYSLREALQKAIDAEKYVAPAIELLDSLPVESELDRLAIEYDRFLLPILGQYIGDAARMRLKYLDDLQRRGDFKAELRRCEESTLHWFDHWAWTLDPREVWPLKTLPFNLFEFQRELIKWIEMRTFRLRTGGLIDKARDQGVSWVFTAFCTKHWRWRDSFIAMFGSRKEDYVDKLGDPSTLLEKCRFQIGLLPEWMLPENFDEDDLGFLRLVNRDNKSLILGESSNKDIGRAGRYSIAVFDEFASFERDEDAYAAMSQSASAVWYISTPKGMQNLFARLRHSKKIPVRTLEYKLHPWKNKTWVEFWRKKLTAEAFAQEIDLDYKASQTGRLFGEFDDKYHVITWAEFARYFGKSARDSNGQPMIPFHWQLGRAMDFGTTPDHPTAVVYVARPGGGDRLRDCIFVYREIVLPKYPLVDGEKITPVSPQRVADRILRSQASWRESDRMAKSLMSHEQSATRNAFLYDLKNGQTLNFDKWNAKRIGGISTIQNYLAIDWTLPHPFRPQLGNGRTRIYFIVADSQGELFKDETGKWCVLPPLDEKGLARLRAEIPEFHLKETEGGDQQEFPDRKFNDAIDALRMLADDFFPPIAPMTSKERAALKISEELSDEAIQDLPRGQQDMAAMSRGYWMNHFMKNDIARGKHYLDKAEDDLYDDSEPQYEEEW